MWTMMDGSPAGFDVIGYLTTPSESNPKSAREQMHDGYPFGGFQTFKGFRLGEDYQLTYPGDPPIFPVAQCKLREEQLFLYSGAWVAIIQPDRSFEVARMD